MEVMPDSPIPRRVATPRWLDLRLIIGVLVVLGSVLVGARVFAAASSTQRVWVAAHDLAPGEELTASDVRASDVHISAVGTRYVLARVTVAGQVVSRTVGAGELLPRSALGATDATTTVTIPFEEGDAPKIMPGDRITVWVSTRACPSAIVLGDVVVQSVHSGGGSIGGGSGSNVVVKVRPNDAVRIVTALALPSSVLRAGVLAGPPVSGNSSAPDLTDCAADPA